MIRLYSYSLADFVYDTYSPVTMTIFSCSCVVSLQRPMLLITIVSIAGNPTYFHSNTFFYLTVISPHFVNESVGTLMSSNAFGSIIFAITSNPVIVLGPGLLKYDPALTA
jgi:hypothetical protein